MTLAQLAFDLETRQKGQLLFLFRGWPTFLNAQFAHVQSCHDPFAYLLAHRLGQLRHKILDLRIVRDG